MEALCPVASRRHAEAGRPVPLHHTLRLKLFQAARQQRRRQQRHAALLEAARRELKSFAGQDGSVRFRAPAHIVTATRM